MGDAEKEPYDLAVGDRAPLQFLFLPTTGMAFYVMARRSPMLGYYGASMLAAHQAIELLTKIVIQQHDRPESEGHFLASSMRKHRVIPVFQEILSDQRKERFLEQLTEVYKGVRYGQKGAGGDMSNVVQLLDAIVHQLWREFLRTFNLPGGRFYVAPDDVELFLKDNRFFATNDFLTSGAVRLGGFGATDWSGFGLPSES